MRTCPVRPRGSGAADEDTPRMPALRVREFDVTSQYPITLAEFRAWLETKRPTAVVGERGYSTKCPIASYVRARGEEGARVYEQYLEVGGRKHPLPGWATLFVGYVDHGRGGVQACTALRLLDKAAHATLPPEDDWERTQLETEAVL